MSKYGIIYLICKKEMKYMEHGKETPRLLEVERGTPLTPNSTMNRGIALLIEFLAICIVMWIGAIFRFRYLNHIMYWNLDGDNLDYRLAAEAILSGNYTDFREPGFPMFLALIYSFITESEFLQRTLTTILSVIDIFLVYVVARKLSNNRSIAIISALLMDFESGAILNSARGLREELLTITLLAVVLFSFRDIKGGHRKKEIGNLFLLGISTGYSALVSLTTTIPFVLALIFTILIRPGGFFPQNEGEEVRQKLKKQNIRKIAVIVLSYGIIYLFWSIHCQIQFGYWDIMSRFQATVFYTYETGGVFPNSYQNFITLFDYFFTVRPFDATAFYFFDGFYIQITNVFIQHNILGTLPLIGTVFLVYGCYRGSKRWVNFYLIYAGFLFTTLALFSPFDFVYRYYLPLKIFEIILVSTGVVNLYKTLLKKNFTMDFRIWFFDPIFKNLNKITRNRVKDQCTLHISLPAIFFLMICFMLYLLSKNVFDFQSTNFQVLIEIGSIISLVMIFIPSFFNLTPLNAFNKKIKDTICIKKSSTIENGG